MLTHDFPHVLSCPWRQGLTRSFILESRVWHTTGPRKLPFLKPSLPVPLQASLLAFGSLIKCRSVSPAACDASGAPLGPQHRSEPKLNERIEQRPNERTLTSLPAPTLGLNAWDTILLISNMEKGSTLLPQIQIRAGHGQGSRRGVGRVRVGWTPQDLAGGSWLPFCGEKAPAAAKRVPTAAQRCLLPGLATSQHKLIQIPNQQAPCSGRAPQGLHWKGSHSSL